MKVSTGNSWWRYKGFDEAETTIYFGAEIITNIFSHWLLMNHFGGFPCASIRRIFQ